MTTIRLYTLQPVGRDITHPRTPRTRPSSMQERAKSHHDQDWRQPLHDHLGTDAFLWTVDTLDRFSRADCFSSYAMRSGTHNLFTLDVPQSSVLAIIDAEKENNAWARALVIPHGLDDWRRLIPTLFHESVDECIDADGWPSVLIHRPLEPEWITHRESALDHPKVRQPWLADLCWILENLTSVFAGALPQNVYSALRKAAAAKLGDGEAGYTALPRIISIYKATGRITWQDVTA